MSGEQKVKDLEEGVVEAYRQGRKLRDIEAQFGVGRSTLYWILERHGVVADRANKRARLIDGATLAQLMELIEHQNSALEEANAELKLLRRELRWWRRRHPDESQGPAAEHG